MTRVVTLAGYAALVLVAVVLEVRARRLGRATLADALDALLRPRPVRAVLVIAWLWFGWHLFARVE